MQRYTVPQRVKVIEIYYRNQLSIRRTFRALREIHGPNNRPTEATIRRIVSKFEATGSVENLPTPRRRRSARSLENIAAVRENVQETPKLSILRRSQELGLSPSSVRRILHLDHCALWPRLQEIDLANIFFQQDGATCHTARETLDLLAENFQGRTISRNGDFNWPARSCDLTPLDFFLWGYVKSLVYENKPRTIEALRDNIVRVITEIEPDICQKVITNWTSRLHAVRQSRGGHLPDVIFHT